MVPVLPTASAHVPSHTAPPQSIKSCRKKSTLASAMQKVVSVATMLWVGQHSVVRDISLPPPPGIAKLASYVRVATSYTATQSPSLEAMYNLFVAEEYSIPAPVS